MELYIDAADVSLPATLDTPLDGPARAGVVVLHGSATPQRSDPLYAHLARVLPPIGVAVLRFDRRPFEHGDVPFAIQADDAIVALTQLRRQIGQVPVGLWGWSQGTWPATAVAARCPELIAFLILVGTCGISPALQMRYGTAQQLLRHGYREADLAELADLRQALERAVRGHIDPQSAQAVVDRYADQPWFPLANVPRDLRNHPGTWPDMDYDPEPFIARVRCPTLLFYGENDEWTPAEESIEVWRRAAGTSDLTIHRLAGCTHAPTLASADTPPSISPDYTSTLLTWTRDRIGHRP